MTRVGSLLREPSTTTQLCRMHERSGTMIAPNLAVDRFCVSRARSDGSIGSLSTLRNALETVLSKFVQFRLDGPCVRRRGVGRSQVEEWVRLVHPIDDHS